MIHIMEDEWAIIDIPTFIDCSEVYAWLDYKKVKPQQIKIKDIGHKPISLIDTQSQRYLLANLNLPGIVVKSMKNPSEKPYRMIDGRHRLKKSMDNNKNSILVYVISEDQAHKFIKQYQ